LLVARRDLWKLAAAPVAISAFLLSGGQYLLYRVLVRRWEAWAPQDSHFQVLYYAAFVLLAAAMIVLFFFLFAGLAVAVAGPFNEAISARTEAAALGRAPVDSTSFSGMIKETVRSVTHGLKILLLYGVLLLAGCLLFLVPAFGPLLFAGFSLLLSAYMAAYQFMDYPMARRGFTFNEKIVFLKSGLIPSLGFGLGVLLLCSVPLVNVLLLPGAVVGGTLLFLDLEP
jgi:CysZ protein